jgi:hypothetical protein
MPLAWSDAINMCISSWGLFLLLPLMTHRNMHLLQQKFIVYPIVSSRRHRTIVPVALFVVKLLASCQTVVFPIGNLWTSGRNCVTGWENRKFSICFTARSYGFTMVEGFHISMGDSFPEASWNMYSQRLGAPVWKIQEWTFAASFTHIPSNWYFFFSFYPWMKCYHSTDAEKVQVASKVVLKVTIHKNVLNNFSNTGTCMWLLIRNIFKANAS